MGAGSSHSEAEQQAATDDRVLAFRTLKSGVSGRIVRLGAVADTILARHAYPEPVSRALGEAVALTAMLGAGLKSSGRLILQTRTDGALSMLVTNFDQPGALRGYARFDADDARLGAAREGRIDQGHLLGHGHLAMTIDPGGDLDRYQGIVSLDGQPLVAAAHTYFKQSEQLPTCIRLAVARHFTGGVWQWRAGGLMIQHVATAGGKPLLVGETGEQRDARLAGEDDENWTRARLLTETVEDHELLDPLLTSEDLLLRLYHEEGVRVLPALALSAECRCSRERIGAVLGSFGAAELADMREADGAIGVTCEFCSREYRFAGADLGG